jgi:hypothetical protein
MQQINNPLQACINILYRPGRVFQRLATTDNWSWLPFLLVVAGTVAPIYYYFALVDFQWYKDTIIGLQFATVSPAEQRVISASLEATRGWMGKVIGPAILIIIEVALVAAYLNLAGKKDELNVLGFSDWYGLVWWALLPTALASLLSLLLLSLTDSPRLLLSDVSPTAFSYLFAIDMSSKWFALCSTIKLEGVWTLTLLAIGIKQWTHLSTVTAYCIAFIPVCLIGLIWVLVLLF